MKFSSLDRQDARRVIAAMVSRTVVLGRIAARWRPELFGEDRASQLVAGWCCEFFDKYGEAPGRAIQQKFEEWEEVADSAEVKLVERLLSAASEEESGLPGSDEFLIDLAGKFFHRVSLEMAVEHARLELREGQLEAAENLLESRMRPELGSAAIFKPGETESLNQWESALSSESEKPLIHWPRDLGRFFSDSFSRDSFITFMGASGRAKSFWLLDTAYRALRQKNRVAYFEAGDLSESQVLRRMAMRALRRPLKDELCFLPSAWENREEAPEREERQLRGVSAPEAMKAWKRVSWGKDAFRLVCCPNSSVTSGDIASYVEEWTLDGWVPDVIVIDYADILALPQGYLQNPRDGINENWKRLRRLSQEKHCCVVTATQSDAGSYETEILRRRNFTDDRRKFDHVTSFYGINQNLEEKQWGVQRLNCLKQRSQDYGEGRCCWVAGCLAVARPSVLSSF